MTSNLKFLDITNYLAAGSSYANYLKAFEVEEQKGFFPYEYVKSFNVLLKSSSLPAYKDFYSHLNNNNPLEEDVDAYRGLSNYHKLQTIWKENDMKNLYRLA